jgi:hypothetical protein
MPAYGTLTLPPAPFKQDSTVVWNAENPASATASERIAVTVAPDGAPPYFSVDIIFSSNPATFEIDIQESDTDVDADYQGKLGGAVTTATLQSDGTYRNRVDLNNPVTALFLRAYMATAPTYMTGAPKVTVKITRQ